MSRFVTLLAFLVVIFGLLVWAGTLDPAPALGDYPGNDELAADYDRYVGDEVTLTGDVVDTDPTVIVITLADHDDLVLTVTDLDFQPEAGDRLRVFGVVRPGNTIESSNAFTVPRGRLWYTWSVSFLAGLWVLARLLNHWSLDTETWSLHPRTESWLGLSRTTEADSDA